MSGDKLYGGRRAAQACLMLVGTPFHPGARKPGLGMDCVGVLLHAVEAGGLRPPTIDAYSQDGGEDPGRIDRELEGFCERICQHARQDGDLLVFASSPKDGDSKGRQCQHVAVAVGRGFVHAHSKRGVEFMTRLVSPWTELLLSTWRPQWPL